MEIGEEELSRSVHLLPTNAATWSDREGLAGFFVISREFLVAKPAFRGEDIWILEIDSAAMSYVCAELHVSLERIN